LSVEVELSPAAISSAAIPRDLCVLVVLQPPLAVLSAWIAGQKNRSGGEGFNLGALFGPLGVLVEALLPAGAPRPPLAEAEREARAEAKRRRKRRARGVELVILLILLAILAIACLKNLK
jgi:hypothetical protein